jgi:hypothetical protein
MPAVGVPRPQTGTTVWCATRTSTWARRCAAEALGTAPHAAPRTIPSVPIEEGLDQVAHLLRPFESAGVAAVGDDLEV